ncbi:MAG: tetratricopeptide repeat protein [Myxococcota bacterium]
MGAWSSFTWTGLGRLEGSHLPDVARGPRWKGPAAVLLLLVATGGIFANTLGNGYVWDDFDILVDNPQTHDLGRLGEVLLSPDQKPPYYRPLPRASFVVEIALFGQDPRVGHAVSLTWHLAAVVLLFLWAQVLFRRVAPAFAVALLWAVHPVAAEAVGFISVRTGTMAVALSLATLLAFWRGVRHGGWGWLAFAGVLFLAALGSKEQAGAVLPLAAGLLWLAPRMGEANLRGRTPWALLPLGLGLGGYLVARVAALGSLSGDVPRVVGQGAAMGVGDAVLAAGWYLRQLLWPTELNIVHNLHAAPTAVLVTGALALLAATVWSIRRPTPAALFGVAWFWLTFAPTVQWVALPSAALADRQAYIMGVGLACLVVQFGVALCDLIPVRWTAALAAVCVSAAACALSVRTIQRNSDFADNGHLYAASVAVRPSALAHLNLGNAAQRAGDLDTAREHWEAAVALDPRDADALTQLGVLHARAGDFPTARDLFRRALEAFPGHPAARGNLERVERRLERVRD